MATHAVPCGVAGGPWASRATPTGGGDLRPLPGLWRRTATSATRRRGFARAAGALPLPHPRTGVGAVTTAVSLAGRRRRGRVRAREQGR